MKKYVKPQAYAAETKDHRHAGTFEVLVPLPDRVTSSRRTSRRRPKARP